MDLDIYINNNSYHTKTHFKLTNTFSYLHGSSNHPPSTFKGVHKGENIRILRNTSEEHQYLSTMRFITSQFRKRKYPSRLTSSPVIPFNDRATYLTTADRDNNFGIPFITTFDPSIPVRDSLLQNWPRLSSHHELRTTFTSTPLISYKRNRNLSQLLVRAKLNHHVPTDLTTKTVSIERPPTFPAKNIPCRHQQCGTCPQLTSRSFYSSYQTKQYFCIPDIYSLLPFIYWSVPSATSNTLVKHT